MIDSIEMIFFAGENQYDVSSFVQEYGGADRVCSEEFKHARSARTVALSYNSELISLLQGTDEVHVIVNIDGERDFSGRVTPATRIVTRGASLSEDPDIESFTLELEDYSYLLDKEITSSDGLCFENVTVCNPGNKATSAVHILLAYAGMNDLISEVISANLLAFAVEAGTVGKALETLLYEYGYTWTLDKAGKVTLMQWMKDVVSPEMTLTEADMVGSVEIEKIYLDEEAVEAIWYPLKERTGVLLFMADLPFGEDNRRSGWPIQPGYLWPEEANIEPAWWNYENTALSQKIDDKGNVVKDQDFTSLVLTRNHSIEDKFDGSITRNLTLFENKRARVEYRNNGTEAELIYYSNIHGDAIYRAAKNSELIEVKSNPTNILKYESKHIHDADHAKRFASALARHLRTTAWRYQFNAETNLSPGSVLLLCDSITGVSMNAIVIEKTPDYVTGIHGYKAIGISTLVVEQTQSQTSVLPAPAQPQANPLTQLEKVPTYSELNTGYSEESLGLTTVPTNIQSLTVSAFATAAMRLTWDRQETLTNLAGYEVQVSDAADGDWYALCMDSTHWRTGNPGEVTTVSPEMLIHPDISPVGKLPGEEEFADDPQPRTLFYRVRRVTKLGDRSPDWVSGSGTISLLPSEWLAKDSIAANRLKVGALEALIASINKSLTIGDAGFMAYNKEFEELSPGDTRAYLDKDEVTIERCLSIGTPNTPENATWERFASMKVDSDYPEITLGNCQVRVGRQTAETHDWVTETDGTPELYTTGSCGFLLYHDEPSGSDRLVYAYVNGIATEVFNGADYNISGGAITVIRDDFRNRFLLLIGTSVNLFKLFESVDGISWTNLGTHYTPFSIRVWPRLKGILLDGQLLISTREVSGNNYYCRLYKTDLSTWTQLSGFLETNSNYYDDFNVAVVGNDYHLLEHHTEDRLIKSGGNYCWIHFSRPSITVRNVNDCLENPDWSAAPILYQDNSDVAEVYRVRELKSGYIAILLRHAVDAYYDVTLVTSANGTVWYTYKFTPARYPSYFAEVILDSQIRLLLRGPYGYNELRSGFATIELQNNLYLNPGDGGKVLISNKEGALLEDIPDMSKPMMSQGPLAKRICLWADSAPTKTMFYLVAKNNTDIVINGNTVASDRSAWTTGSVDVKLGDIVESSGPVFARLQKGTVVPVSFASTEFVFKIVRNTPLTIVCWSPYFGARVSWTLDSPDFSQASYFDVDQDDLFSLTFSNLGVYRFKSTLPVLIYASGDDMDESLMYPMSKEIIIWAKTGYEMTMSEAPAINNNGYVSSDEPCQSQRIGDGVGASTEQGLPVEALGNVYACDHSITGYVIVAIEPTVITVYSQAGNTFATHDLSSASKDNPMNVVVGDTSGGAGSIGDGPWIWVGTSRFYVRTNDEWSDEYPLIGYWTGGVLGATTAVTGGNAERGKVKALLARAHYGGASVIGWDNRIITWGNKYGGSITGGLGDGMEDADGTFQPGFVLQPPFGETSQLKKAVMIAHSIYALYESGNLYVLGYNNYGHLGLGDTTARRVLTLSATGVSDIIGTQNMSWDHNRTRVLIKKDGYWWTAGYNGYRQLGCGTGTTQQNSWTTIKEASSIPESQVAKIWTLGGSYGSTWIQKTDGRLLVSGYNGYNCLGKSGIDTGYMNDVTSVWLNAGDTVIDIQGEFGFYDSDAKSYSHTTMLIENSAGQRRVMGCGHNGYGSLGDGSLSSKSSPVQAIGLPTNIKKFVSHGGGAGTKYALMENGDLWAWGYNSYGAIGNGETAHVQTPVRVLTGIKDVFAPCHAHTYSYRTTAYAVAFDGSLYSTGHNAHGQCGVGDSLSQQNSWRGIAFDHVRFGEVVDVSANGHSAGYYMLFLTSKGFVFGLGYNGRHGLALNVGDAAPRSMMQLMNFGTLLD